MSAVQKLETPQQELAPVNGATAIISMIERAARDPSVDIDKMERLLQMQERVLARDAKMAYDAALAQLQPELPIIGRRGKIEVRKKDASGERTGAVQQSTGYALWEDINEGIRPKLAEHGFALSFRVGQAADGKITITGILSHSAGHREETTITLMHDSTGSKNSVQAVGSSVSYGKRYTASALLNITSRGEDDDGKAAGADKPISADEATNIRDIIKALGDERVEPRLLTWLKVESIEAIPAARYDEAIERLKLVPPKGKQS
jgi:hypothetical protein